MNRSSQTRPAFTLLEVVLATSIGAMVILVGVALLHSMERLERPLAIRQQELADLHRARIVIQRAMSSLVMSDSTPPVNPNARRNLSQSSSTDEAGKSAFEASAEATATKQQQQARPPARLLLEADQTEELKSMLQQVGVPVDSAGSIQRMEVVVDTPPIAPNFRAELGDVIAATYSKNKSESGASSGGETGLSQAQARAAATISAGGAGNASGGLSGGNTATSSSGSARGTALRNRMANAAQSGAANGNRRALALNANAQGASKSGALRGAFEIRPMLTDANLRARRDGNPILYELWWSPLPAAKETSKTRPVAANPANPTDSADGASPPESAPQANEDPRTTQPWGEPVLLADNLVKCRWQLFSTGEKRGAHHAVWDKELPAYVEFEIQTKTGLYENWMFEIGWTKGPELASGTDVAGGGAAGGVDVATPVQGGNGTATSGGDPQGAGSGQGPRPSRNGRGTGTTQPQPAPPSTGPRYETIQQGNPK